MAANHNIRINQGSTFKIVLTIKDSDDNPIDLTGFEFCGQIRKTVSDPVIQASFSFIIQDQVTDTGKVFAILSDEQTMAINVRTSRSSSRVITTMTYDIESKYNGETTRWIEGLADISPEASRCL
jgi:hypothetical protein